MFTELYSKCVYWSDKKTRYCDVFINYIPIEAVFSVNAYKGGGITKL